MRGYQVMPDGELLAVRPVRLATSVSDIVSRAGVRVNCKRCGEEIINERELLRDGRRLCRACAGPAYYRCLEEEDAPARQRGPVYAVGVPGEC